LDQIQVSQGDSLSSIAYKLYGNYKSWREISALNPQLSNPDQIEVGQILYVQAATVDTASYLAALLEQVEQVAKVDNEVIPPSSDSMSESDLAQAPPLDSEQIAQVESEQATQVEQIETLPQDQFDQATSQDANTSSSDFGELSDPNNIENSAVITDPSEYYMLIGILLIAGALIALLVNRIRRKKAIHQYEEHTQIHEFPNNKTGT